VLKEIKRRLATRTRIDRLSAHAHQRLAEILALQQAHESRRRILEALGYVLAMANAAVFQPGGDQLEKIAIVLRNEFAIDEAAQRQALGQDGAHGRRQQVWSCV